MAYIPGYTHDIFISYAHNDDLPWPGAKQGWVSTLVDFLSTRLTERLGRKEMWSLWFDQFRTSLNQHQQIDSQISDALEQSAILLVILSPGYITSEWCDRERSTFLSQVKKRSRSGSKVFVINKEFLDSIPQELCTAGNYQYCFWEQSEKNGMHILGTPIPTPEEIKYYNLVTDLTMALEKEMKELKARNMMVIDSKIKMKGTDNSPKVYLAEVTDDIDDFRCDVQRYLVQAGINVVPAIPYSRSADAFVLEMEKDLKDCSCFVQLLSNLPGKKAPGSDKSYPMIQYLQAVKSTLPVLQWRHPDLSLSSVTSPDQRMLLDLETVMVESIESFKQEIKKVAIPEKKKNPVKHMQTLIFVNHDSSDQILANEVKNMLVRNGSGWVQPLFNEPPSKIRESLERYIIECEGMIIIYGSTPVEWVQNQLFQYRKIIIKREQPIKVLAIFQGPPEKKEPLNIALPGMELLDCQDGAYEGVIRDLLDKITLESIS